MKKIVVLLCVVALTVSAKAQVYLGGEFNITHDGDTDVTDFTLAPEIGYKLNNTWDFGLEIGYSYVGIKDNGTDKNVNAFHVAPYARWTYFEKGIAHLFLEGGLGFSTCKVGDADSNNGFEVGVKPGLALEVNEKFAFIAKLGFLGYRDSYKYNNSVSGLSVGTEDLSIGFIYSF